MYSFIPALLIAGVIGWFAPTPLLGVLSGVAGLACVYLFRTCKSRSGDAELAAGVMCIGVGMLVVSGWVGFALHRLVESMH